MPKPLRGRSRQSSPSAPVNPPAELTDVSPTPAASARPAGPARRPTYPEALARYERGMRALQEHRFGDAADAFRTVLAQYPEEKELADRARQYLAICERQLQSAPEPKTLEERLYAATLALNAGDGDTAMRLLGEIVAQDPEHDGALYMLGVAHALRDDPAQALDYLQRAIRRNPDNRSLALQDADLEGLLEDEAIRNAVEGGAGRPSDLRFPPPPRSSR
jgi:tetratricopeptide (TPR) repeat protein